MSSWGAAEFADVRKLADQMKKMEFEEFMEECCRHLAARLLSLVILDAPVGVYPDSSGRKGGNLRRGWISKGNRSAVDGFVIEKEGDNYMVTITNSVEYSSYVEYGHRTGATGWVAGKLMLTHAELQIEKASPLILEKLLYKKLKEALGGD